MQVEPMIVLLACVTAMLGGCSDEEAPGSAAAPSTASPPEAPPALRGDPVCDPGGSTYEGARNKLDYVGIRIEDDETAPNGESATPTFEMTTYVEDGTPCASASDPARCRAALDASQRHKGWKGIWTIPGPAAREYLVFTEGDRVGFIFDKPSARQLLAPFETPAAAALAIRIQTGFYVSCGDRVWKAEDGIHIRAAMRCSSLIEAVEFIVSREGVVTGGGYVPRSDAKAFVPCPEVRAPEKRGRLAVHNRMV